MLVRDIMTTSVVTIPPGESLEAVCELMHDRNIRHLPVLDAGRLVGVVTDRDVFGATGRGCLAPPAVGGTAGQVMSGPVHTVHPLDPVEDAARTMRRLKIGCLPVLDGDWLVGIVTGIDLLDALLAMTGVHAPSGRVELRLEDRPGELARLTALVAGAGANVHSLLTHPDRETGVRTVVRVNLLDTRALAAALREAGFDVVWPPAAPWRR